jgi:hypothetical protein
MKKAERGNILLGLLTVILLGIIEASYFFDTVANSHSVTQKRYLTQGSVKEILSTADQALESPKALMNSVRGPLNKTGGDLERCMSDGTYDCPKAGGPFSIYLEDPTIVFSNAVAPDSGLSNSLQPCSGYSNSQDFICISKLKLVWKPTCPAVGACTLPPIDVSGVVEVKLSFIERITLNTSVFTFAKRIR